MSSPQIQERPTQYQTDETLQGTRANEQFTRETLDQVLETLSRQQTEQRDQLKDVLMELKAIQVEQNEQIMKEVTRNLTEQIGQFMDEIKEVKSAQKDQTDRISSIESKLQELDKDQRNYGPCNVQIANGGSNKLYIKNYYAVGEEIKIKTELKSTKIEQSRLERVAFEEIGKEGIDVVKNTYLEAVQKKQKSCITKIKEGCIALSFMPADKNAFIQTFEANQILHKELIRQWLLELIRRQIKDLDDNELHVTLRLEDGFFIDPRRTENSCPHAETVDDSRANYKTRENVDDEAYLVEKNIEQDLGVSIDENKHVSDESVYVLGRQPNMQKEYKSLGTSRSIDEGAGNNGRGAFDDDNSDDDEENPKKPDTSARENIHLSQLLASASSSDRSLGNTRMYNEGDTQNRPGCFGEDNSNDDEEQSMKPDTATRENIPLSNLVASDPISHRSSRANGVFNEEEGNNERCFDDDNDDDEESKISDKSARENTHLLQLLATASVSERSFGTTGFIIERDGNNERRRFGDNTPDVDEKDAKQQETSARDNTHLTKLLAPASSSKRLLGTFRSINEGAGNNGRGAFDDDNSDDDEEKPKKPDTATRENIPLSKLIASDPKSHRLSTANRVCNEEEGNNERSFVDDNDDDEKSKNSDTSDTETIGLLALENASLFNRMLWTIDVENIIPEFSNNVKDKIITVPGDDAFNILRANLIAQLQRQYTYLGSSNKRCKLSRSYVNKNKQIIYKNVVLTTVKAIPSIWQEFQSLCGGHYPNKTLYFTKPTHNIPSLDNLSMHMDTNIPIQKHVSQLVRHYADRGGDTDGKYEDNLDSALSLISTSSEIAK